MESPYSVYKWFTPRFALNYFARLAVEKGEQAYKDNKYKKAREAWILGLALLGINKLTNLQWWLQVPKDDPPDMRAMTLVSNEQKNQNEMNHREIEITQITKYSKAEIEDEILKKLKNKYYTKETCLLVYINRNQYISDMRKIAKKLEGKINISDIWIVASTSVDSSKHILFCLHPHIQVQNFDLFEEANKIPPGDLIELKPLSKGVKMTLVKKVPISKFIPE